MVVTAQAPALVVPKVMDVEHCRRLIAFWDRGAKLDNLVSGSTYTHASAKTKVRADVSLGLGTPESDEVLAVLRRRLLPEMAKALDFEATRFEPFRVGCYDAEQGGYFAPHRDNTQVVTAHRRYALTINLNTGEYVGGFLRMPEYGPQLYAPETGGAVVFSCSLLHLATPVRKGRRFVLVGFFWREDEQKIFERSHADTFPLGSDINRLP